MNDSKVGFILSAIDNGFFQQPQVLRISVWRLLKFLGQSCSICISN